MSGENREFDGQDDQREQASYHYCYNRVTANVYMTEKGVSDVITLLQGLLERLVNIVADSGYYGGLIEKIKTEF